MTSPIMMISFMSVVCEFQKNKCNVFVYKYERLIHYGIEITLIHSDTL